MVAKVIIRIDDIGDKYDFYELKDWFISNYPKIPVVFYVVYSHYRYRWGKKAWVQIKDVILENKWEIGGHTRNHHHLPKLSDEKLKHELVNNIDDITNELKSVGLDYKITSFAYPFGEFDDRVKKIIKQNGIIYGLTYPANNNYETQIIIPEDKLYEINVSCNGSGTVLDWNKRFKEVFDNEGSYILCLHTSHWNRGRNRKNLKRLLRSKSIKELYHSLSRFFKYLFKKSTRQMWKTLSEHIDFILKHSEVQFITFKDLI